MSVRFGILSTAKINEQVLAGARDSELVEVAAVASDQARAEEYAREHGIARAYGGYEKLLADPELDAVCISLPNSLHVWLLLRQWLQALGRRGGGRLRRRPPARRERGASGPTTPGTSGTSCSSFAAATVSRRSPWSRSTPIGWSWRISPTRSGARIDALYRAAETGEALSSSTGRSAMIGGD
jgi:hypothetical protein